eukprot:g29780.t1
MRLVGFPLNTAMRRRRVPAEACAALEPLELVQPSRALDSLIEHGLLERVCDLLPALEVGRISCASEHLQACIAARQLDIRPTLGLPCQVFAREVVPRLLAARCRPGLSLQTAHASEVAEFVDWMRAPGDWRPGPNTSKPYNVAKEGRVASDDGSWIFLEGGTDWLGSAT